MRKERRRVWVWGMRLVGEGERVRGRWTLVVRLSRGGGRRCCIVVTRMTVCQ